MVCSQPHLHNHGGSLPARLVAELGDGAACGELVACVVRRHGRRLPIARFPAALGRRLDIAALLRYHILPRCRRPWMATFVNLPGAAGM